MPENEQSVANLVRDALRDVQDLVRAEIALARAEVREEGRRLTMAVVLLGVAAVAALVAVGLLGAAAAWGVAALFVWPPWAGYALVGAVVLLAAVVAGVLGRRRLVHVRPLPRTIDTLKEHAQWIRRQTS